MSRPNHFAKHKPCIVLLEVADDNIQALRNEDGSIRVFERFTKANKFVSNHVDPELWPNIRYVNENPEAGAGDREETNNKKCLRCGGFLRLSPNKEKVQGPFGVIEIEEYECPRCD